MWRSAFGFFGVSLLFASCADVPAQTKKERVLPAIDNAVPEKIETATFSLG